jgi:hypothetical protein
MMRKPLRRLDRGTWWIKLTTVETMFLPVLDDSERVVASWSRTAEKLGRRVLRKGDGFGGRE